MEKLFFFFLLLVNSSFLFSQTIDPKAEQFLKSQPRVFFKENKGQVSDQNFQPRPDVLFYGSDGAMNFHLRKNGISYQLSRVDSWKEMDEHLRMLDKSKSGINRPSKKVPDQQTVYRVDVNWLGANPAVETQTGKTIQGVENYYTTVCPEGVLGVRSFESIQFANLYEGIDLKYYEHEGHLKYDYLVEPGADYKQIKLEYQGATSLSIDKEGNLIVETPLGTLYEPLPLVTQNGKQLEANWQIKGDVVSFEIQNYDASQAMIIDPLVRVWGTYYGGSDNEYAVDLALDLNGDLYFSGSTSSLNQIATFGAFQNTLEGVQDSYFVKFNLSGNRDFSSYFGGEGIDSGGNISVDSEGNIIILGQTNSLNSIFYDGFQNTFGGEFDGFLAKFNSIGQRIWCTYFGGLEIEVTEGLVLDVNNDILICGYTTSTSQIAFGGFQNIIGGERDAFLVKFETNGQLLWSTYYGGSNDDLGMDLVVDLNSNIYLTGETKSQNQIAFNGFKNVIDGESDAFLVKFNSIGQRIWSTYYGGDNIDGSIATAIDFNNNVYIGGGTNSINQISFTGFQNSYGGNFDGFMAKFDENGQRLYASYYGGLDYEYVTDLKVDNEEKVYLVGGTFSNDLPILGSYQNINNGDFDAFVAKFDQANSMIWGTYYGGEGQDFTSSLALNNASGVFYMSGITGSTSSISFQGFQNNFGGGDFDSFVVEFKDFCSAQNPILNSTEMIICPNEFAIITCSPSENISWSNGESNSSITVNESGSYFCQVLDSLGCIGFSDTITINVYPNNALITGENNFDFGSSTQLFASGGETYSWQPPTGLSCTDCPNPIVQPEVPTSYTVTVTDSNGCVNTKTVFVNINTDGCLFIPNIFSPNLDLTNNQLCLYGSCLKSGTFTIYNRWGEKVFETTDVTSCWDGTYKGEPVGADVFVYKLNGVLVTGEVVEESGNIEVVR